MDGNNVFWWEWNDCTYYQKQNSGYDTSFTWAFSITWYETVQVQMEGFQWCWSSRTSVDRESDASFLHLSGLCVELHVGWILETSDMLPLRVPDTPDLLVVKECHTQRVSAFRPIQVDQKFLEQLGCLLCPPCLPLAVSIHLLARKPPLDLSVRWAHDALLS